jgi:hypothetical protein
MTEDTMIVYEVTFYFTSGQSMVVTYTKDKFIKEITTLRQSWNACCIATDEVGINFSQVSHYSVKQINKDSL